MKAGLLMLVVATVGATWLLTPRPDDAAAPAPASEARYMSSSNPWSKDHVVAVARTSPRGSADRTGETVLPRRADGHFYAAISIGGRDAEMLVDTGASVIALTAADARALGVDWREDDVVPVARGASGTVWGVPVRLERVRLGDIEVSGVEAVVVPRGLPISLLGQSFLGRVGRVEIANDKMVLGG